MVVLMAIVFTDLILNAFWDDETGEYTPWMEEPARIIAVGK